MQFLLRESKGFFGNVRHVESAIIPLINLLFKLWCDT
jgi:hypothetical protein